MRDFNTLTYSTNEDNPLNERRRAYWSDRYMLGCATAEPDRYDVKFWLSKQSPSRARLAKFARALRERLPAKKLYRIQLAASVTEFVIYEYAHSYQEAKEAAHKTYGEHFAIVSVEEVAKCQSAI